QAGESAVMAHDDPAREASHIIELEHGWETWSIRLEAPLGWNPQVWQYAGCDRAQWYLPYPYSTFPLTPGTIVSYCMERPKLREARNEHEISRYELGIQIGYCPGDIRDWETGEMNPDEEATLRLCRFFKKRPADLDLQKKYYVLLSIGSNTL